MRSVSFPILAGCLTLGVLIGLGAYGLFFSTDGRHISVSASGTAEWLYQDTHIQDHQLEFSRTDPSTPPQEFDSAPFTVKVVDAAGNRYDGPKESQVYTVDRVSVPGSIHLEATDVTPLDAVQSWDSAKMDASFSGPDGEQFSVVLRKLVGPDFPAQTFGGVALGHLIHGETGLGTDKLHAEFAYEVVLGLADVYKDGELIGPNVFTYVTTSQRAQHALNEGKQSGHYDPENPLGKLIVHLVIFPYSVRADGTYTNSPFGVIAPNGKEQEFLHINFTENIQVEGSRFFNSGAVQAD